MIKVRKVHVLQFALFQTVVCGLIGLLCGIFYSVGGLIIDIAVSLDLLSGEAMGTPGLSRGTLLAFGALLGMPLIGASAGFVFGLLEAVIYNLIAHRLVSFKIDAK